MMEGALPDISGEYFYSIAAFFSLSAYLLRSMLWLRILLVCAALVYIVSGVSLGLTAMVGWNLAYVAINLYHIVFLLLDRITINLPPETRKVYQRYFSSMSTREFRKLITSNGFRIFQDQNIVDEGEVPDKLFIILRGHVNVVRDNETIARLGAGNFIGEMSFVSKEPASANAWAEDLVQCAFWTHDDLEKLRQRNIGTYNNFLGIIGHDLVRKLRNKNEQQLDSITKLDFVV